MVDDHDLFRAGIASLLSSQPDIEVIAQAGNGQEAIHLAVELEPDVVLMDLRMPDLNGTEAIRAIVEQVPSTRVLALTVLSDEHDVEQALAAGACGFLAKETPVDEVALAIRAATQGAAWLSPRAAEVVLGRIRDADSGQRVTGRSIEELSPRELDVLRLIARGMENTEIAATLQLSPRTVKNHVSSVLSKLGLPSRVQAAIYAVRSGLD